MKKKILILLLVLLTAKFYSQTIKYTITQDCCSTTSSISLKPKLENNIDASLISKGEIVNIQIDKVKKIFGNSDTGYNNDDEIISKIKVYDENDKVIYYPLDYLKLKNGITIPGVSIDSTKRYKKESMLLFPSYYYEVLKTNNINTLFKYETYWKNGYYENINNNRYDSWVEIFSPNCILIANSYIYFYKSDCEKDDYLYKVT